jgi:hypothetical protein
MDFFDKLIVVGLYSLPFLVVLLALLPFAIANTIEENRQRKADDLKMKEWGLK